MVPKLHAKGRSFRGAAAYLLHDKDRARSSERVVWTETRNLVTDDPHQAWRVMAATAMDRDRLKQQAGVKNTGRKSDDSVLHMTLSWHPDEKPSLSRDEMMRAALGAIRALRGEDRQALFVCHNDEPQPHVHVLLNRVSPHDGRMLPSSKEKLALSRWAESYERERGKILCEERAVNNAARRRGEFTRGQPDRPRHIYELEAANSNRPGATHLRHSLRKRDAAVAKRERDAAEKLRRAREDLVRRHRERVQDVRRRSRTEALQQVRAVREAFKPEWRQLFRSHEVRQAAFSLREGHFLGRAANSLRSIDFGAVLRSGDRRRALSEAFRVLSSGGARVEAFRREQERRDRELAGRQKAEEQRALADVRRKRAEELATNRQRFVAERDQLRLAARMERATARAGWKTRAEERAKAWGAGEATGGRGSSQPECDRVSDQARRALEAARDVAAQRRRDQAALGKPPAHTPQTDRDRE